MRYELVDARTPHEPWYKYGVAVLVLEMAIAIAVSAYSLYMTFHGSAVFRASTSG